jgi:hypothetical protein
LAEHGIGGTLRQSVVTLALIGAAFAGGSPALGQEADLSALTERSPLTDRPQWDQ